MSILIGLGHKARQGKNYVANYMVEANPAIRLYAFADELKKYCRDHHEDLVPQWQLAKQTKQMPASKSDPIYGFTPILQWYGTDVVRKQNPNHWVEVLATRLETEKPDIAVITDVRFPNEADFIKQSGGYLVDVIRLNADGSQYQDPGRPSNHPSEVALDEYEGWDFVIRERDGNLSGLRQKSIGLLNIVSNYEEYMHIYNETDVAQRGDEIAKAIDETVLADAVPDATGEPYDQGSFLD